MKRKIILLVLFSIFIISVICSCGKTNNSGIYTVKFNTNIEYSTNNVLDQSVKEGSRIKKPTVFIDGDNPDNLKVYNWYREKECKTVWNFKTDKVEKDMTLYALWKREFTVNYYLGYDEEPIITKAVFEGDYVDEYPEYAIGYEYYGSFSDINYQNEFDFSKPITSNASIYMKRSDGFCLREGAPSGNLYDNLEIFRAGDYVDTPEVPQVGTITKTADKQNLLIDFGYSPDIADPYIQFGLTVDITKSPIFVIKCKYLGYAKSFKLYFTSIIDKENYTYSASGRSYSEAFSKSITLRDDQIGMSEDDDWTELEFDLASVLYNGYSIWGTSSYLGTVRIQPLYKSTSKDDNSNKMILNSIYGKINEKYENGVIVEDSEEIKEILNSVSEVPAQDGLERGFKFPLDNSLIKIENDDLVSYYTREDGTIFHFSNEIEMRKEASKYMRFSVELPMEGEEVVGDKQIDLKQYSNLYIKLRNFGYADRLVIYICNDYGGELATTVKMNARMNGVKTFSINLSKENVMKNTLTKLIFEYEAVGVDNAILIDSVYFEEPKPFDIVGVSFDDRDCLGFESDEGVDISYDVGYSSVVFDVKVSNSIQETSFPQNRPMINHQSFNLNYTLTKNSNVLEVYVSFKVGDNYTEESKVDIKNGEKVGLLNLDEEGLYSGVKLRFIGQGVIRITSITFNIDEESTLDLNKDYVGSFLSEWKSGCDYIYDSTINASYFNCTSPSMYCTMSFYIGYCYAHRLSYPIYEHPGFDVRDKNYVYVIYQNRDTTEGLHLGLGFHDDPQGNSDTYNSHIGTPSRVLKKNMGEYEWDIVYFELPKDDPTFHDYLVKVVLCISGGNLAVRAVGVI